MAWDWRNWSLNPDYLFSDPHLDTRGYRTYGGRILSLSFADDQAFSPAAAVHDLLAHFPAAQREHREIRAQDHGLKSIGHFGFFQHRNQALWSLLDKWLNQGLEHTQKG